MEERRLEIGEIELHIINKLAQERLDSYNGTEPKEWDKKQEYNYLKGLAKKLNSILEKV